MRTVVDLMNLSPSVPLSGDIPERVWKGKDVSYKHLRVFGCRAFVHIPRDERFKLDEKSKQCIFLGYDQTIEDIEKEDKPKPIARNDSVYEPELPTRDVNDGGDANTNDGYTDADMACDVDSRKSTSRYMMTFVGGAVSWQSKLKKCVAMSSTKAEYITITEAGKELLWMKRFLAVPLDKRCMEGKQFSLEKIHTDDNDSDMMTKTLPMGKFATCRMKAGMVVYDPISS
ncbi:hypothetical protein L6164_033144 [Bauhinia variegata]|uniref:Uncharacterized protein n=1 Tax=Bauhinia variegata TaxID=167791 RepID=A0ACB9KRP7_BAUVA|nr:hypothetical protein L6164_033144 [Bauhinia variegata]